MDQTDIDLRNFTYGQMRKLGRAPTAVEIAGASGSRIDDVRAGWRRLHNAHTLVLNHATAELRMLNPFSAVPSHIECWRMGAGGTATARGMRSAYSARCTLTDV